MKVVLLGPQRRPTVESVVRSLGLEDAVAPGSLAPVGSLAASGPFATVTAGWQEREPDDGELRRVLGGRDVNLALYRRWLDVQERDPEYFAAERALGETLAEMTELYLVRLDYALRAVYALQRHSDLGGDALRSGAVEEAIAAVRELDAAHLRQVNEARLEFYGRFPPHDRPVIAGHRAEVAAVLRDAPALVLAGGHVGVLADVLHLFNVAAALPSGAAGAPDGSPADSTGGFAVIAWSAGAMALTDRIVLFGDRSPQGPGHPEVYGSGLSLVRDVVLLPHARARLLLDDAARMAVLARRFGPARCVPLETGTRIDLDTGDGAAAWPAGTRVLGPDGHVAATEAA
ncbi:MAG: hypothetical protein WAK82_02395 [Streptosporangiaceae bacterium]